MATSVSRPPRYVTPDTRFFDPPRSLPPTFERHYSPSTPTTIPPPIYTPTHITRSSIINRLVEQNIITGTTLEADSD